MQESGLLANPPDGHPRKKGLRTPRRSIACNRCHEQKSKCSGERPCLRCRKAGCSAQCRYAHRDRKVRVGENYLEQLLRDSEELHAQRHQVSHQEPPSAVNPNRLDTSFARPASNPATVQIQEHEEEAPWFQIPENSDLPVYTSEAACAAFATRLCQCLRSDGPPILHIPRCSYTDESTLFSLGQSSVEWPSLISAKLLLKTALGHINPAFHLVLKRETLNTLESVYAQKKFDNIALKCKYFTLFAIAKVYSIPHGLSNTSHVPGTEYFARALGLLQILPERPSIIHIEILLLLAYFCQFLNRLHSAYLLIGNALRLGLTAGLNHNVPSGHSLGPINREHRKRLWWSIYVLDRFWGSKSGFPVQMQDDDIHVDLPSQLATENYGDQFSDSSYQIASIELARITGNTTREIYTRPKSKDSFLQREQKLLIELKEWVKSLPEHLRLHPGKLNSKHTVLMHLQFSYCVTLGLRPVLLHLIKRSYAHRMEDMRDETAPVLETLSEACIHAARYSLKLCIEEWTSGSLAIFGYAFPAFIFSSSLVLVASNLLTAGDQSDAASVETAAEMLQILSTSHNLAAKDFHEHLQSVREHLRRYQSDIKNASGDSNTGFALQKRAGSIPPPAHERTLLSSPNLPFEDNPTDGLPPGGYSIHDFTTEMVLESALMQEFLTQSTSEVESLNPSGMSDAFDAAFFWPYDSGLLDS